MKRLIPAAAVLIALLASRPLAAGASGSSRSDTLERALENLQKERAELQAIAKRGGTRVKARETRFLELTHQGLSAAREMLRKMAEAGKQLDDDRKKNGLLEGKKIVLDAGHGGEDPGCSGILRENGKEGKEVSRLLEKDLTLEVSARLAEKLRAEGAEVFMTRREDETLDLYGRGLAGKAIDADLFMSVHFNYSDHNDPSPEGGRAVAGVNYTTVYVYAPARGYLTIPGNHEQLRERLGRDQPAASTELAERLFRRLSGALDLTHTLSSDIYQRLEAEKRRRARLERSAPRSSSPSRPGRGRESRSGPTSLALRDHSRFYSRYPEESLPKGVRRADFVVLRHVPDKPAVLVETCFLGDEMELRRLHGKERRTQIVDALFEGLCDYLLKRRSGEKILAE